ncbi:MAG TPA: hypothetical protein VK645_14940 [Chitinophagaceae bacterium]|nr:hypothetical protein [Chitinophagaceae bacterium]
MKRYIQYKGIDSISITPDSVIKTIKAIHQIEKRLADNPAGDFGTLVNDLTLQAYQ